MESLFISDSEGLPTGSFFICHDRDKIVPCHERFCTALIEDNEVEENNGYKNNKKI